MKSAECVERQLQFLEQLLEIRLILRVRQCCWTGGSQPIGAEGLKLHCVGSGPLRGSHEREGSLFVSSVIETCFRDHIDAFGVVC